jgi:chromate transporter
MIFFELFITFFTIGLFTFGGGYAMIPMINDQVIAKGWLDLATLTDFIAISEVTPGPFAINIATFIGSEVGGIFGSVCATIGVVLPSVIIIILVAWILSRFLNNRYVKSALGGIQPIIIGLILSTAITFFIKNVFFNGGAINPNDFDFDRKSLSILLILFIITNSYKRTQKKNLNPIIMLLIAAGLGILIFA